MAVTLRRRPETVSTSTKAHPTVNSFIQANFAGIMDSKNDVTIEQTSFVDAQNVYVNEDNILVSRPPFKFRSDLRYVLKEWVFGTFHLVLTRDFIFKVGANETRVDKIEDLDALTNITGQVYTLIMRYRISCISHDTTAFTAGSKKYDEYFEKEVVFVDRTKLKEYYNKVPNVFCAPIEDKIFIWYDGTDFVALNTSGIDKDGKHYLYFEDARKYIYVPIRSLVINGIESDFETPNFLTSTYRKRYQRSLFSNIDLNEFKNKTVDVYLSGKNTQNKESYLYSTKLYSHPDMQLIYPYCPIGTNNEYKVSVARTEASTVVLRYEPKYNSIEVSFDGTYFRALPALNNIVGEPMLTEDGLYAVAFTEDALCKCKLVASETSDFSGMSDVMTWSKEDYFRLASKSTSEKLGKHVLNPQSKPTAKFKTIDNFVYIVYAKENNAESMYQTKIYGEWLGFDGVSHAAYSHDEAKGRDYGLTGEVRIDFKIPTPTITSRDAGPVMSILYKDTKIEDGVEYYYPEVAIVSTIGSLNWSGEGNVATRCTIFNGNTSSRKALVKLKAPDYKVIDDSAIHHGDIVALIDVSDAGIIGQSKTFTDAKGQSITVPAIKADLAFALYRETGSAPRYSAPRYIVDLGEGKTAQDILTLQTNFALIPRVETSAYQASDLQNLIGPPMSGSTVVAANWADIDLGQNASVPPIPAVPCTGVTMDKGASVSTQAADTAYNVVKDSIIGEFETDMPVSAMDIKIYDCITSNTSNRFTISGSIVGKFSDGTDLQYKVINFTGDSGEGQSYAIQEVHTTDPGKTFTGYGTKYILPENNTNLILSNEAIIDLTVLGSLELLPGADSENTTPIAIDETGVWLCKDNLLWTSAPSDTVLEIDLHFEGSSPATITNVVPEHFAQLSESYFSFTKGGTNYLEITSNRHSEFNIKENKEGDILLYLPEYNEEVMSYPVTALHPLTDKSIGVFTEEGIWSVTTTTLSDGSIAYTRPLKSKIPFGLRKGDEVITAFDGQAIIFPARRGVAVLQPQDLSTTEEKTINYLTDAIDERYRTFYEAPVSNTSLMHINGDEYISPEIHLTKYLYWLVFYKYMSHEILLYDTRTGAWWKWKTAYPIMSIYGEERLNLLLRADYSPVRNNRIYDSNTNPFRRASLLGIPFVLADREMENLIDVSGNFPLLDTSDINDRRYYDDVIADTIDGVPGTDSNSVRNILRITTYADKNINWYITSQKLHFGLINNYKFINGINLNLKGTNILSANMHTKCFRDLYHPESSSANEIKINELRTFNKRLNLMHVINFQYKLENNANADEVHQLQLNEITIKYEGKERIR